MKIESKLLIAASLGLMSVTSTAFAEEEVKAAPTLGSVLEASGITATGYVAASVYTQDSDTLTHQFDSAHEEFKLDQAAITLAYQPESGFGGLVNVITGEDARVINSATGPGGKSSAFSVFQAFVQYKGGPVTFMAGKMATLAGAEVAAVSGNTNYSRSLLFFNEPLVHSGVRVSVAAGDMFSFTGGINNGWNYDSSYTSSKTAEVGIGFTPSKKFSLLASGYSGEDAFGLSGTGAGKRTFVDLVATFAATDSLSFIVSYDNGKQDSDDNSAPSLKWDGIAAYVNVAFSDQWRLSLRGETIKFKQSGSSDSKYDEFTATVGFAPVKSFEFRGEIRVDSSNKIAGDGLFTKFSNGDPTDSGTELALQAVYKF